ncbi:PREDICTED: POPTR_0010s18010g [Prunus dulcis]|uniref:PREDICTED: POPTR_0010s18010g n=1 Tax=Prunus dulcis TaxID=3755 RepID=A0A5E4FFP2_PRUDU|nr:PREDICTED: POPTR_0010s18010g [Prunus dulcis]
MKKIFVLILIFWIGFGHGQRTFDVLEYGAAGDGKTDDSKKLKPAASVLDLVAACPPSPNLTFLWGPADVYSSSWVEFYRAVRRTLHRDGFLLPQDGLGDPEEFNLLLVVVEAKKLGYIL